MLFLLECEAEIYKLACTKPEVSFSQIMRLVVSKM